MDCDPPPATSGGASAHRYRRCLRRKHAARVNATPDLPRLVGGRSHPTSCPVDTPMMIPVRAGSCAVLLLFLTIAHANAHPHVWVTIHSEVLYSEEGAMTGVRHAWTFDDMFSAYALQGISHARKGQYTRAELASLAEVNVTSLKEYAFFTYVRADEKKLKFAEPVDYWLEYKNPSLILH